MNYSLSVQRDIGFKTVVDVGYQATLGRHLQWEMDQNAIPIGADFLPSNIDPTTNKVLTSNFLRPYVGYGAIYTQSFGSSSNYNSLQVSARRRFARNFQFGAAWTWSKAMDFNDADTTTVESIVNPKEYYYGLASFDRTHTLSLNYIYNCRNRRGGIRRSADPERLGALGHYAISKRCPDGRHVSRPTPVRISRHAKPCAPGEPDCQSCSAKEPAYFWRELQHCRPGITCSGHSGRRRPTIFRGPGIENWDLSLLKNFTLYERLHVQLRVATFNTFNHTQFTTVNTAAVLMRHRRSDQH